MILGIDPKVDYAFKMILGQEETRPLLIDMLNAVLRRPEGEQVESVKILNPFNPMERMDDKTSIVDIRARDQRGRLFNVEMQVQRRPDFISRYIYYAVKTHQRQLRKSQGYDKLRPTISICFTDHVLYRENDDYRLQFGLLETRHHFLMAKDLEFHLFELPKFRKTAEELTDKIDLWLYFLRHAEKMDPDALPPALQTAVIGKAIEELIVMKNNEAMRIRYEDRIESQRAYETDVRLGRQEGLQEGRQVGLQEGRQEGLQEGRQEGLQEGRQEGRQEGTKIGAIQTLERLLGKPQTPIERFSGRSLDELDRQIGELEQQLLKMRQ